jgi:MPBQ/MSBQ methyltransferase
MADKQRYADELLRVLKPGGRLAVADWNRRDPSQGDLSVVERWVMRQLLDNWAHPEFASIESLQGHLQGSHHAAGITIETGDWSIATLPSWFESILEGARRPAAVLGQGLRGVGLGLREVPTLVLMHWAFATGLMRFGVFRGQKPL